MFKILDEICIPTRGTKHSAAIDLKSREDIVIGNGETVLVPLGVKIDMEAIILQLWEEKIEPLSEDERENFVDNFIKAEKDNEDWALYLREDIDRFLSTHYLQLMLRSGLGKKGLILPNGVGIIDLDYPDEIMMIVYNATGADFEIKKGDRVGQIILLEHKSDFFNIFTDNQRKGGFGSTGKK